MLFVAAVVLVILIVVVADDVDDAVAKVRLWNDIVSAIFTAEFLFKVIPLLPQPENSLNSSSSHSLTHSLTLPRYCLTPSSETSFRREVLLLMGMRNLKFLHP